MKKDDPDRAVIPRADGVASIVRIGYRSCSVCGTQWRSSNQVDGEKIECPLPHCDGILGPLYSVIA